MTDPHAPTSAGPTPGWTPVGDGTDGQSGAGPDPLAELPPEAQLGAAFAGGILAALILKRLGRR